MVSELKDIVYDLLENIKSNHRKLTISIFSDFYISCYSVERTDISLDNNSITIDSDSSVVSINFNNILEHREYETESSMAILLKSNNANLEISGV